MRSLVAAAVLICLAVTPLHAQPPAPAPSTPMPAPATPTPAPTVTPTPLPAQLPPGRTFTLEEAVATALEGQPQIVARLHDYEAARYRVDQALAPLLPQLAGSWTAARAQDVGTTSGLTLGGIGGSDRTITSWRTTTVARVTLSQLLFDFGKSFATVNFARRLADVALEDIELQRQLIALAVKEAYTNMLFARRLILVNQQALERADLNLRSARGFFEVGTRPRSDVTRAEVDVANARVDVIRARNAERLARAALNVAIGLYADTPTDVIDNLAYQPVTLDARQLQREAIRQRPEFRQARLQADSNEFLARRAFLDFFPDITGTGSYGATRADMNEIWELGLSLNWSLFDGGNRIARYREARANLEAAKARVRAQELEISREVEQAIISVDETQERIQAAQVAVVSAQENFRLAQGRFDAGVGTILELTDAQLALTQAQNLETQALADYRVALARLDRAVGRR